MFISGPRVIVYPAVSNTGPAVIVSMFNDSQAILSKNLSMIST
jgi:hypothetical protein